LIVEKNLLLAKQTNVRSEKTSGAGIKVTQKIHEKKRNAVSNLCCQSVQDPCRIVFENCWCAWNRSSWCSDLKKFFFFRKNLRFLLHIAIVYPKWRNLFTKIPA